MEDSNRTQKLPHQGNAMSATTQNTHEELRPAVPVFSYAQAAKGKMAAPQLTPIAGKGGAEGAGAIRHKKSAPEPTPAPLDTSDDSGDRRVSESQNGQEDPATDLVGSHPSHDVDEKDVSATQRPSPGTNSAAASPSDVSAAQPMQEPDNNSTSIAKEKEPTSMVNGSSSPNLPNETQSLNPRNGATGDEQESTHNITESAWGEEDKPTPTLLKDAPPPPVNFWAQRMAQAPRTKPLQVTNSQVSKPTTLTNGVSTNDKSPPAATVSEEQRLKETKKKPRSVVEERPSLREGYKPGDGKAKSSEGITKLSASSTMPPPPPGDASSWPTPDSAIEEDKKKSQERVDKEKPASSKPHGKKEWQHVPFVPTVAFNTPLPQARRGGRPPGAPRDGGPRGRNNNAADKSGSTAGSPTNQSSVNDERSKATFPSSAATTGSQKPKRASSAGPMSTQKESRRPGEFSGPDRRREIDSSQVKAPSNRTSNQVEQRRQSATAANESVGNKSSTGRNAHRDGTAVSRRSYNQNSDDDRQTPISASGSQPPRGLDHEKRSVSETKTSESARDSQPAVPARERGEGRSDRGRGGYRGRGGGNQSSHNGYLPNGPGYSSTFPSQYTPMSGPQGRSFSNHERVASQTPSTFSQPGPSHGRNHRSNSRSQSIPHPYGRFSHTNQAGPPHLANLQTDLANNYAFQPEPQGPMSAIPFNPYMQGANLFGMVTVQMEYYFSVDNLCKDTYLRSHMTSQGFVPLQLVAGFRRIQQLTPDLELVRYVCLNSQVIEFRVAEDGTDWIRRRDDWQQWVLNPEDRVAAARNDGPAPAIPFQNQFFSSHAVFDDRQDMSPRSNATAAPSEGMQYHSLDNVSSGVDQMVTMSTMTSTGHKSAGRVPLSAAVSEFSPSVRGANNRVFSSPDPYSQGINLITDEDMDKLNITFRARPADVAAPVLPPFHSASSRTFSNGSIDGSTISSELSKLAERQPSAALNGDQTEK